MQGMNYPIPKSIIGANPDFSIELTDFGKGYLEVAEFFYDTIQGENNVGYPSAFLRLQHCTLNCVWCDSQEVWRYGNPYSFDKLFELIEEHGLIERFKNGQHLVLTGGSPLKQQVMLIRFLTLFKETYGFTPFIEIENECTIMPWAELVPFINCWNNSPKLKNSGNSTLARYKRGILLYLSTLNNSYFKFVISNEEDWAEIKKDFLDTHLINRHQIVLMPEGVCREDLKMNRGIVLEIAIRENVRYTNREHIMIWDKMTGV
jgi:organic radical activating enzyme